MKWPLTKKLSEILPVTGWSYGNDLSLGSFRLDRRVRKSQTFFLWSVRSRKAIAKSAMT